MTVRLCILDQSPTVSRGTSADALRATVALAKEFASTHSTHLTPTLSPLRAEREFSGDNRHEA